MASLARGAPLPQRSALVEDPQFQEILLRSRSLTQKVLLSVDATHQSCVYTEGLRLNSSDKSQFDSLTTSIGIPPAPVLKALSESFSLETCLTRMTEGLQLHRVLLSIISVQLDNGDKVTELVSDVRDLTIQINKMLRMVQSELVLPPSPSPLPLRLRGEYDLQVATHLVLVSLQEFGQDMLRNFKSLDVSNEEEFDN